MIKKKVLVCPLDWGLGHASRVIPIIESCLADHYDVIIGADRQPLQLLRIEYPGLPYISFPSFLKIRYSPAGVNSLKLFTLIPEILWTAYKEHLFLKNIISEHKIDIVISDNRYGLWNKNIQTIFISHQLRLKLPGILRIFEYPVSLMLKLIISRFSQCVIPDNEGFPNLSGDLSHKSKLSGNTKFIGPLSRFTLKPVQPQSKVFDILAILSGPEPQRTSFENILLEQLKSTHYKVLIIRGLPDNQNDVKVFDNVTMISHQKGEELKLSILSAEVIICRSGYSGIMDLIALKKKAILVPTPGQTEQEYLAKYHAGKNFYCISQGKFNLAESISMLKGVLPLPFENYNYYPSMGTIFRQIPSGKL